MFLLHEEFAKPTDEIRTQRMSRYLYDLCCLKQAGVADGALHDMSNSIVHYRPPSQIYQSERV